MADLVISKREKDLGGGFIVGRLLPYARRRMVGPFIFFDHMGPVDLPKGASRTLDVRPHPHIGLATVTYLYAGQITHRDSVGSLQDIMPGDVNWMVAGKGVTHSERFEALRAHGGHLDGIQAWVALPDDHEEDEPSFEHLSGPAQLPEWSEGSVSGRLIAGDALGLRSATKTFSPMFYIHWDLKAGARTSLPAEYSERALYVAHGTIEVDGHRLQSGEMVVLDTNKGADLTAVSDAVVMALGGEPVGERHIYWNFVSSSRDRLEQAKEDWQQQRMKLPDLDDEEFIPLPEDHHVTIRSDGENHG